jgi:E3 ubiquitin-protein ligase RNF19A
VKFEFDEDEDVVNKQHADTQSVDAVSRIGATSIGEVSLSVASHLGVGSSNAPSSSVRESTTALAGSING